MADVVRILGLDDDNHAPMFRFEDGSLFETPQKLIKFLALHHDVDYDVRMFSIVDQPSKELAKHDMEAIDWMFMYLEGVVSDLPGAGTDPDAVFDLFWNSANREHW